MSKTDGMLLEKFEQMSDDKINKICFYAIVSWMMSPILMLVLNILNISQYTFHGIITILLYLSGCLGLIFGGIYIVRLIKNNFTYNDKSIEKFQPVIAIIILGIWCVFCTAFANEKRIAVYGYESLKDNLFTFLFFGGLFLGTLSLSSNDKRTEISQFILSFVGIVVSILSLVYKKPMILSGSAVNTISNNEIVFYGEYLTLVLLVTISLTIRSTTKAKPLLFLAVAIIEIATLISDDYASLTVLFAVVILTLVYGIVCKDKVCKYRAFIVSSILIFIFCIFVIFNKDLSFSICFSNIAELFKNRLVQWNEAFRFILSVPIVGVGPQNTMEMANSTLLQCAMYLGVPGLLIMLYGFFETLKSVLPNRKFFVPILVLFLISISISASIYYVIAYYFIVLGFCSGITKNSISEVEE